MTTPSTQSTALALVQSDPLISDSNPGNLPAVRGVVDLKSYHTDGVDPITGLTKLKAVPNAKLNEDGKKRIVELIAEYGLPNAEVVKRIVAEGFVTSFSVPAVAWWRKRPEVQLALRARTNDAFQVGLASRVVRTDRLKAMTEALIKANFATQEDGSMIFIEEPDARAKGAQAAMIGQIRDNFKILGELAGDNDPLAVVVDPGKSMLKRLGQGEKTPEEIQAMLQDAMTKVKLGAELLKQAEQAEDQSKAEAVDAEFIEE